MSEIYESVPLPDEDSIRILSLHPAKNLEDPIIDSFSILPLSVEPEYQAFIVHLINDAFSLREACLPPSSQS